MRTRSFKEHGWQSADFARFADLPVASAPHPSALQNLDFSFTCSAADAPLLSCNGTEPGATGASGCVATGAITPAAIDGDGLGCICCTTAARTDTHTERDKRSRFFKISCMPVNQSARLLHAP